VIALLDLSTAAVLLLAPGAVELPPGPAADATARIPAGTAPAPLPAVADDAWTKPAAWKRSAELLSAEATSAKPDPARRAELALLALAQHRYADAWIRYAECADSAPTLAALLPHFLPGVPVSQAASVPLAADPSIVAVLAPALPPFVAGAPLPPRGYVQHRAMRIDRVAVGGSVLAMRVSVENEGVQIDLDHVEGPPVKVAVRFPEDPEYGYSDEYVDWFRQDRRGVPHEVALKAGDETHTLYARFEPRKPDWPTKEPDLVPAQLENGSILFLSGPTAEQRALADAVAAFLRDGPLKIEARRAESRAAAPEPFGVAIDLTIDADRARKLAWLAGSVERRVLDRDRPGRSR
jgi:hypothetical protein